MRSVVRSGLMVYFAYGSNMCTGRLRTRVPSAKAQFKAKVSGRSLRFHKRSSDGSGKADAYRTGDMADAVWGVVFEIDPSEKPDLDRAEGLGRGYHQEDIVLTDGEGRQHTMFTYIADGSHIEEGLRPYSWYKRFVIEGARKFRLPEDYIQQIAQEPERQDPDENRDAQNRTILCEEA